MKKIWNFMLFIIIILAAALYFPISGGYEKYKEALSAMPLDAYTEDLKSRENYTEYNDIPKTFINAVVAVEDRRFYKHRGFDLIGSLRAVINDIKARELLEGGSTITQQLAKNIYFESDNTLERKIAEIFMALKIENMYSKEEILELYANNIYYGSGYYCIFDASYGYFNKAPIDMTDDECTLLAGIPNAPSVYSLDVNPDLARQRQEKVLQCMAECGYI